jgi:hypothetical protein
VAIDSVRPSASARQAGTKEAIMIWLPAVASVTGSFRRITLAVLAGLTLAGATGCGAQSSSDSGGGGSAQGGSAQSSSDSGLPASTRVNKYGQVTVTGAVTASSGFPVAQWSDFPGDISVMLTFEVLCTVKIAVPHDTQPGTYPMVDDVTNDGHSVSASYYDTCRGGNGFRGKSGTLTLTSTSSTWSGTFDFTAVGSSDSSKTVHVSGSFKDVPKV